MALAQDSLSSANGTQEIGEQAISRGFDAGIVLNER
jgi:hypothetical protein